MSEPIVKKIPKPLVTLTPLNQFVSPEGQTFLCGRLGKADLVIMPNAYKQSEGQPSFYAYIAARDWGHRPPKKETKSED